MTRNRFWQQGADRFFVLGIKGLRLGQAISKMVLPVAAVIASAIVPMRTAAAVELLTVCGSHRLDASATSGKVGAPFSHVLALSADGVDSFGKATGGSIALTRDQAGYDLIVNWREADEHSLRAAGLDLLGTELGGLIHVMVAHRPAGIEHYLFTLDEDGSGELLWSGATSPREDGTSKLVCNKLR